MTEAEIKDMNREEIIVKLVNLQKQLRAFGWTKGISFLNYGAKSHGAFYEERRYPGENGPVKPTPMNCLAVIADTDPKLFVKVANKGELLPFLQVVSQIGMYLEVFSENFTGKFPNELT
jgi:hypothetical protein